MAPVVQQATPKADFIATMLSVLLVPLAVVNTITYESAPSISYITSLIIAVLVLGLVYITALLRPINMALLVGALGILTLLTVMLHFSEASQQFDVLLRYILSLASLFTFYLAPLPDLRRMFSYMGMVLIVYAAYIGATAGAHEYAGTARLAPFYVGVVSSSLMVAAFTLLIALSPFKRITKVIWVGTGLALLVGYGVVTILIMIAVFFGGWYFLRRGWKRVWLYILGVVAAIAGILFRDNYSVAGADIATLGWGSIGSGRLNAWVERFDEFADRDIWAKLSGLGPYSDYRVTSLWYWEEKSAHSDVVTLLMEFGVVGLFAVLLACVLLYKGANKVAQLMLIAMGLGAAASNVLLDRPVAALAWGIALYACRYHSIVPIPQRGATGKDAQDFGV